MQLGTSKRKITPKNNIRLSGYASREGSFDDVKEDIFVRIYYFKENEKHNELILIYGDILWWGSDFVESIKNELIQFNIPLDRFVFIASHNHSGPPTSNNFTETLETYDEDYAQFLKENVVLGVKEAKENLENISVKHYKGTSDLNVYRRVLTENGIEMRPNYNVEVDKALNILTFYRDDSTIKGLLLHYPCHPNISNENFIQPDYPGVTLRLLDEKFDNSVAMFLSGATGDIRPNIVLGNHFLSGSYEEVVNFADYLYQDTMKVMNQNGTSLRFNLDVSSHKIELPLENLKKKSEIQAMLTSDIKVEREWANKILQKDNRNYETLELSRISLTDKTNFITVNAEVSQKYSKIIKDINKNYLTISYTNGMVGYVCSQTQINEGGYEPIESTLYFALSGTYKPEIEELIKRELETILER